MCPVLALLTHAHPEEDAGKRKGWVRKGFLEEKGFNSKPERGAGVSQAKGRDTRTESGVRMGMGRSATYLKSRMASVIRAWRTKGRLVGDKVGEAGGAWSY